MTTQSRVMILTPQNYRNAAPRLTGIAMTPDAIIIETDGLKSFEAANPTSRNFEDGRFFAVLDEGQYVRAFTDPMGQDTLFYYEDADWLISNSFYGLAQAASAAGKRLTLRHDVLGSFFIYRGNTFGSQLISSRTPFAEIKTLPLGCELHIDKATDALKVVRIRPGDWLTRERPESYTELIEVFVLKTCGRIRALAENGRFDLTCDLSGGHDSRALVGMTRRAVPDPRAVSIFSHPSRAADFVSASAVANAYGFEIQPKIVVEKTGASDELYTLWKQASLGVYLPPYAAWSWTPDNAFRIHGGNFLSKEFGELSARARAAHFRKNLQHDQDLYKRVRRLFYSSFASMDVDMNDQWAMQLHYISHRNKFHYGRNWSGTTRMAMITPLISQDFAFAAFKASPSEYNHLRPCLDLLLAIDNQLALIDFDSPKKCWKDDELTASPFWRKPIGFKPNNLKVPAVYAVQAHIEPPSRSGRSMLTLMRKDVERLSEPGVKYRPVPSRSYRRCE